MIKFAKVLSGLVLLVGFDQIVKYIIRSTGGFYICNKGVAFGWQAPDLFLIIFWSIFLIWVVFYFISLLKLKKHTGGKFFESVDSWRIVDDYFILIVAGAFANLIDRMRFGCVIDFIDLKIWPVFNLADVFIFLGAVILAINIFRKK
ncbi:signal peptidase II [Patescibacteria group bacterium]